MESRLLAGRYRLNTLLGRGGMAVVWRAVDEQLDREVAVKAVELTGPDSEGAAERFRKEARTTARLNHPNIVTVFDSGVDGQTAYIVMELLSGPTLAAELLEHGPMQFDEVRRIGQQVCAGLAAAHDAGVIHRDIKPGNIAYAGDDAVKVLDFGITQLVDEAMGGHSLTAPQTVLGTAEYLSPEQASALPIDARADLYAFGCVLAVLLTGQPPFLGASSTSVLLQHTQAPLPDFSARRPGIPQGFIDQLHDLLAKDRSDRPATARDVQQRLAGMSLFPPGEEVPVLLGQVPSSSSVHYSLARVDDSPDGTGASALDRAAPFFPPAFPDAPEAADFAASSHLDESARSEEEAPSDDAARLDEADTLGEAAPSEDWVEQSAHDEWEELRRRIPPPVTRSARIGQLASLRSAVVLWILAAAAVLLLVILWLAGQDRSAGSSGSSSSLSSGPSATAPAGPSASRTVATSSSLQAVAALRLAVTQARAAREVDARAVLVLHRRLDEITLALKAGGDDKAASKLVDQLAKTINQLADQGHVTYAGQQRLAGPFADLQRQVPPRSD